MERGATARLNILRSSFVTFLGALKVKFTADEVPRLVQLVKECGWGDVFPT
jgi:hypothetical protein